MRQKVIRYLGALEQANRYARGHGIEPVPTPGLLDPNLAKLINRKLRELDALRPLQPETLASLREKLTVDLAYNSNAIEGNTLTLGETKLVVLDGITVGGHPIREIFEARNHKEALDLVYKIAERKNLIRERDVLALHGAITHDTLPEERSGVYRLGNVMITGSKHKPPDWKDAPEMMQKIVYPELNSQTKGAAAVESAAKIHYWTVNIHPFADGNGRLARLLMNFRLIRGGLPPAVTLVRERAKYYGVLEHGHLKKDLSPFANFVGRDVLRALDLWLSVAR